MSQSARVVIIGAGAAGLVTAKTLLDDGFHNLSVLTRDTTVGGVWAAHRIYPGLKLNNVHGEFHFSSHPMPPLPKTSAQRLEGEDLCRYLESFAEQFLKGKIRFGVEVLKIERGANGSGWTLRLEDLQSGNRESLECDKLVLCTGGCSRPHIPPNLSPKAAEARGFKGPVIHSSTLGTTAQRVLSSTKPASESKSGTVVVAGGGKSAQDAAAYFTNQGRKVTMVFSKADSFLATSTPLPDFIRKSRLLAVMGPHINLRTKLERFLHNTRPGSFIVRRFWDLLASASLQAAIPQPSPLHDTHSLYWGVRSNDEGVITPDSFYGLAREGKIKLVAPARVVDYGADGHSLVLSDGSTIEADAVVYGTGFTSSWKDIFDESFMHEIGLARHEGKDNTTWDYLSLRNPPPIATEDEWSPAIYRGIVPAKSILKRDLAINGGIITTNNGHVFETTSHWISSFFLADPFMRLPSTTEQAIAHAERNAAWLKQRYPGTFACVNESYSSNVAFWSWPQLVDELLEDMDLPAMRSGGSWLTWPFKVNNISQIATVGEERRQKRAAAA
ncbi:hypothetical protein BOTBODRAFT_148267 [Botryobasidium botryosum FD-172 SS1]|uniref:FAD/NAD(P)-binding domain-containing protein n=1 Tax=Botryobasidium botryosum (strain FD-172 SS1) TaxID=930990 RepID=A0A067M0T7_BOTB1|nr:hypothetical protein BOTBODRAFT_148267 [Botryobasidium botryosum FD-172 SS1]